MTDWRSIGSAFLDGFAPLDNLLDRPVRPTSEQNLIQAEGYPAPYESDEISPLEFRISSIGRLREDLARQQEILKF